VRELTAVAPGRVNLIGDHTDYNGGCVFPMAIDREIRIAFRPVASSRVELFSLDFDAGCAFDMNDIRKDSGPAWANYILGVAHVLRQEGHRLTGIQALIQGNVPMGSGLSSSAAMEVAAAMAFDAAAGLSLPRLTLAKLCQRAENEFVGVNCGIMDQFTSLLSRSGHAIRICCATHAYDLVPFDDTRARVVVFNSGVKHALVESPYNQRRLECAKAFKLLQRHLPSIETYRDLTVPMFKPLEAGLPPPLDRRARHVVTENARVLFAVDCLRRGDLINFGAAMDASHESLRQDFEVSCPELDLLVALARRHEGAYGARLTGAGFGGCVITLVRPENVEEVLQRVTRGYAEETGRTPQALVVRPSEGATVKREEPS